jgi:hypothetical protein
MYSALAGIVNRTVRAPPLAVARAELGVISRSLSPGSRRIQLERVSDSLHFDYLLRGEPLNAAGA